MSVHFTRICVMVLSSILLVTHSSFARGVPKFKTPEACFAAMKQSAKDNSWGGVVVCMVEDQQFAFLERNLKLAVSLLDTRDRLKEHSKLSKKFSKEEQEAIEKIKQGIAKTEEALKHYDIDERILLGLNGDPERPVYGKSELREMARKEFAIKIKPGDRADLIDAILAAQRLAFGGRYPNVKIPKGVLREVTIHEGGLASARVVNEDEEKKSGRKRKSSMKGRVSFIKEAGGWRYSVFYKDPLRFEWLRLKKSKAGGKVGDGGK